VLISGGVRGAAISVDQLDLKTGEIRHHMGQTVTDDDGYELEVGIRNGIFRITSRGISCAPPELSFSGCLEWVSESRSSFRVARCGSDLRLSSGRAAPCEALRHGQSDQHYGCQLCQQLSRNMPDGLTVRIRELHDRSAQPGPERDAAASRHLCNFAAGLVVLLP
jgi:hypothetical protein